MKRLQTVFALVLTLISTQTLAQELPGAFYHNVVFRDFNEAAQKEKVLKALDAIVEVVQSAEFRSAVLNFKDGKGGTAFRENNGKSNAQIYQEILDAAEKLRPVKDNTMDMDITWYYRNNSTVGYTYANSERIWVNAKFYRKYDAAGVARNIFHEWTHKLGYGHNSKANRPYTVPYGLGGKMEELVKKHLANNP
jgi:hypothetical protein